MKGESNGAASVDAYITALPESSRRLMQQLREAIHAAAPEATETISYQMPTFKLDGRALVGYAAFKNHCSLFPMSMAVIAAHAAELQPYLAGRATVRFQPDKPLPADLVQRMVRARVAENAARKRS